MLYHLGTKCRVNDVSILQKNEYHLKDIIIMHLYSKIPFSVTVINLIMYVMVTTNNDINSNKL